MLDTKDLERIAVKEFVNIFGKAYLKENCKIGCRAYGMINDRTYMEFLGFKGTKELPNRKANEKGWVVYGKLLIDAFTGKVIEKDYSLE